MEERRRHYVDLSQASDDEDAPQGAPPGGEAARDGGRGTSPLSKYWCFTSFNESIDMPVDEKTGELTDGVTYIVVQQEIAPDTGRRHYQGYVEFITKKRRHQVQGVIGDERAHCELRKGTAQQAADYCKKTDTRAPGQVPRELGELSRPAGNQFDILTRAIMEGGATYSSIVREHPTAILRYNSGVRALISARDAERKVDFTPLIVRVLVGPTGCGKSRLAYERANSAYEGKAYTKVFTGGGGDWWDGYADHALVILDDFNGGTAIETLLTLLGGHAGNKSWAIKGGFIKLSLKEVIITSNKYPRDWYPHMCDEHKAALERRITKLYDFNVHNYTEL